MTYQILGLIYLLIGLATFGFVFGWCRLQKVKWFAAIIVSVVLASVWWLFWCIVWFERK